MNKRTVLVALLAGITLAGCGGSDSPAAGPSAMAGGQAGIEVGGVAPLEALAPPVDLVAAPIATSTTRPAARTVAPATVKPKPAPVAVTTTTAVAPAAVVTATTMAVVAPEPTTTTTTPPAAAHTCAVAVSMPAAAKGDSQTVAVTSDAPTRRFRLTVQYPQFNTGKPNPRREWELTTDAAGGAVQTFTVQTTSTVAVPVTVELRNDAGQISGEGCSTTFSTVPAAPGA